jgi:hypothetical protein
VAFSSQCASGDEWNDRDAALMAEDVYKDITSMEGRSGIGY